jgi:hypothetical protein
MSADAIADVVTTYARPRGWDLAPRDLRRTFAKLARSGQAALEQRNPCQQLHRAAGDRSLL